MKITEQQVKDCYENKELLKELFPNAFNLKLEVGKWYKSNDIKDHIFCVLSIDKYDYYFYGFSLGGDYREKDFYSSCARVFKNGFTLTTREEVEKALIAEAEKRGFKEGVKVKGKHFPEGIVMSKLRHGGWDFWFGDNILWYGTKSNGSEIIFQNGKWAEIIQETEIELTLDQIAEKFGVDKVKIKKD